MKQYLLPILFLLTCNYVFSQADVKIYQNAWKLVGISGGDASRFEDPCKLFISPDGYSGCMNKEDKTVYYTCCWQKNDMFFTFPDDGESLKILEWNDKKIVLESLPAPKTKLIFTR